MSSNFIRVCKAMSNFSIRVADKLGRRYAMVIECALFCVGVIVQVCSFHVWQQVAVGRLISGIAVGGLSAAVPMVFSTTLYMQSFY